MKEKADQIGLSTLHLPRRQARPPRSGPLAEGLLADKVGHHLYTDADYAITGPPSQLSQDMFCTRHLNLTLLFHVDAFHDAIVDNQGEALTAGAHSEAAGVHL